MLQLVYLFKYRDLFYICYLVMFGKDRR